MSSRTILITGAAAGINAAAADHLEGLGHCVLRVDLRDGDIVADLATEKGRAHLASEAERLAPDGLDAVVAGAGVTGLGAPATAVQINYFGAVATIERLYPLLARSTKAHAIAIVSTASRLATSGGTVAACLAGDEARAIAAAEASPATAYASSKYALARWIRREAVRPRWAGQGMTLNGIAPGGVRTAMMDGVDQDPKFSAIMTNTTPKAVADYARPEDLAEVIGWLATARTSYIVGQILFVDGGTDAILTPDSF